MYQGESPWCQNMAANFSLTGREYRKLPFFQLWCWFPTKFETVILKTALYEGVVFGIGKGT